MSWLTGIIAAALEVAKGLLGWRAEKVADAKTDEAKADKATNNLPEPTAPGTKKKDG